jgi:hypothetical protein
MQSDRYIERQNEQNKKASAWCWLFWMDKRSLADLFLFAQSADTSGTHVFADQATVLHDFHALDIRFELPLGSPFGMADIVPELRDLATDFTLCHRNASPDLFKQAPAMLP